MIARWLPLVAALSLIVIPLTVGVLALHKADDAQERVRRIETITLFPCLEGQGDKAEAACRALLERLLKSATPEQLKKLRGGEIRSAEDIRSEIEAAIDRQGGGALGPRGNPPPGQPRPGGPGVAP
jgi:hypothetical protein